MWLLVRNLRREAAAAHPRDAAATEALLRLVIQLCRRPYVAGAAASVRNDLLLCWCSFHRMPGAVKMPTETIVELVELVLQSPMVGVAAVPSFNAFAAWRLLHELHLRIPSQALADVHVKRLLALLQGPTAAVATAAYQCSIIAHGPSVMLWLASQLGAVAAAAELGLTPADVPCRAAVALLFSGQSHEDGTAGSDSDSDWEF
jgi:hypothetical protein